MFRTYRIPNIASSEWKSPLNLAITFHLGIALAVLYLPGLLDTKPRYEDIYTVDLVNIAELPQIEPPPAKPQEPAATPPNRIIEKVSEKAISLAEPEPPAAPPAPSKALSLKPLKRKVKKKVIEQPKKRNDEQSRIQRKRLAEIIRAEQLAAEEARILAEEAEIEKRLAEAAQRRLAKMAAQSDPQPASSSALRSSNQLSALENQYYASVIAKLQAYWSLPEYTSWSQELRATVVITVHKDGFIADRFVEHNSGDRVFDRFVNKALTDVGKLPPIPPALKKQRMEIGLNFTPGGIH